MRAFILLTALLLSSCASLNPAGLIAAARLDPLDTHPSNINVALAVPDSVQLRDGDAYFSMSFVPDDDADNPLGDNIPLAVKPSQNGPRAPLEGETIYVLGFAPQDIAKVTEMQTQVRQLRAQGVKGRGEISVGVNGGCLTNPDLKALTVTIWLRTDPDSSFVTLVRQTDLFSHIDDQERDKLRAEMAKC